MKKFSEYIMEQKINEGFIDKVQKFIIKNSKIVRGLYIDKQKHYGIENSTSLNKIDFIWKDNKDISDDYVPFLANTNKNDEYNLYLVPNDQTEEVKNKASFKSARLKDIEPDDGEYKIYVITKVF